MKTQKNHSTYEAKIKLAIEIILNRLSSPIFWEEVARECGISYFHFHRIFTSYLHETPGYFISRKRLEKGILMIAYSSEVSLVDVAFSCGYSSQANFAKAFKKYFGVTPSEVMKGENSKNSKVGKLKSKYGKDFNIESLYPKKEINNDLYIKEVKMKFEIKEFEKRKVMYLRSKEGYKRESIFDTWQEISKLAINAGFDIDTVKKYGIGHDNPEVTAEHKCRYDACIELDEGNVAPSKLDITHFPEGSYACFHYRGNSQKLLQFYLDIYKNWFSANGYEPGDFPLIERYIFVDKDNPEVDIELETQFLLR